MSKSNKLHASETDHIGSFFNRMTSTLTRHLSKEEWEKTLMQDPRFVGNKQTGQLLEFSRRVLHVDKDGRAIIPLLDFDRSFYG